MTLNRCWKRTLSYILTHTGKRTFFEKACVQLTALTNYPILTEDHRESRTANFGIRCSSLTIVFFAVLLRLLPFPAVQTDQPLTKYWENVSPYWFAGFLNPFLFITLSSGCISCWDLEPLFRIFSFFRADSIWTTRTRGRGKRTTLLLANHIP